MTNLDCRLAVDCDRRQYTRRRWTNANQRITLQQLQQNKHLK